MSVLEINKRLKWIDEQPKEKQLSLKERVCDKYFWKFVQQLKT